MAYAEGTGVAVEKSRAEIDALLAKYGASQRGVIQDDEKGTAVVFFKVSERHVRLELPLPKRAAIVEQLNRPGVPTKRRTPEGVSRAYEQATRERWRALVLLVKAKLEAVSLGVTTLEREFLPDVVLADGRTVYATIRDAVGQQYALGPAAPALMLGPGSP